MNILLRSTRWIVAAAITAHVGSLKRMAKSHENKLNAAIRRKDTAVVGLEGARQAVAVARVNVREMRNMEQQARAAHSNAVLAAQAEAKFFGRDL